LLQPHIILTFFNQVKLICFEIAENLPLSAGPVDLNGVHVHRLAKAEICPQVALRQIASASGNLSNLRNSTGYDTNARAPIASRFASFLAAGVAAAFSVIMTQADCPYGVGGIHSGRSESTRIMRCSPFARRIVKGKMWRGRFTGSSFSASQASPCV